MSTYVCKNKKYTKQDVINFIVNYVKDHGRYPTLNQFPDGRLRSCCNRKCGGIKQLKQEIDVDNIYLNNNEEKEEVIQDLRLRLTGPCLSSELYDRLGGSTSKASRVFGNWPNAIKAAFPSHIVEQWEKIKHHKRQYTKEDYLQDYIQTSLKCGEYTKQAYRKYGKYNASYETEFFGSHAALVAEAKKSSKEFYNRFYPNKRLPVLISEFQFNKRDSIKEKYPLIELVEQMENYYLTHGRKIRWETYYVENNLPENIFKQYGGLKAFQQLTRIPYFEQNRILERFYKEKEAIIKKYGRFSMQLHKKEPGTLHHQETLVKHFGSLLEFRKRAGLDITSQSYKYRTWAYTEQEYRGFLWKIYNKYGFISTSLIDNEPGHICPDKIRKKYGGLEQACAHFGIPYKIPAHRSKFYLEIEAKACEILQTYRVQEKTWPWLKYKSRLRVDLFFPLLNLAIEIDGPQHYKNVRFFNESDERYYTALKRDQIKNEELPKHGIDLVRINSDNIKHIKKILAPYKAKRDLIYDLCAF